MVKLLTFSFFTHKDVPFRKKRQINCTQKINVHPVKNINVKYDTQFTKY